MLFIPEASLPHSWHELDALILARLGAKSSYILIFRGSLKWDQVKFKAERQSSQRGTFGVSGSGRSFTDGFGRRYPVDYSRRYNPSKGRRFHGYYDDQGSYHDIN